MHVIIINNYFDLNMSTPTVLAGQEFILLLPKHLELTDFVTVLLWLLHGLFERKKADALPCMVWTPWRFIVMKEYGLLEGLQY